MKLKKYCYIAILILCVGISVWGGSKIIMQSESERYSVTIDYDCKKYVGKGVTDSLFKSPNIDPVLVIRISKYYCSKCVNEFVQTVLDKNLRFNGRIAFFVSFDIPNEMLGYRNAYQTYGIVQQVPFNLPLDSLNVPYAFVLKHNGMANDHIIFGINSKAEIQAKIQLMSKDIFKTSLKRIDFEDTIARLPIVRRNQLYKATFFYINTSTSRSRISKIETGCGCTTAEWDSSYILPGQKGSLVFNITPFASGQFYRECQVYEENKETPQTLIIKTVL